MTLDPHRTLKLRRLKEARDKISEFASRKPKEEDAEFSDWWRSVMDLLGELGGSGYVMRLQTVRFSAVRYNYTRPSRSAGDPIATWQSGLQQADKILQEAIEEAELGPPAPAPVQTVASPSSFTINVNNVFSPVLHVTVTQLVAQLKELRLPPAEQAEALQHLHAL